MYLWISERYKQTYSFCNIFKDFYQNLYYDLTRKIKYTNILQLKAILFSVTLGSKSVRKHNTGSTQKIQRISIGRIQQ